MNYRRKNSILAVASVIVIYFVANRIHFNRNSTVHKSGTLSRKSKHENTGSNQIPRIIHRKAYRRENSDIPVSFFEVPFNVSRFNFRYILNVPQICSTGEKSSLDRDIFLMVLVASASWEFERRNIIRRTWASVSQVHGKRVKFLFFLGNDGNREHNKRILEEFGKNKDIVQEDYKEAYRNLTLKTQGQLKWFSQYCPCAQFFMHVDDDVVPDINSIVKQHLQSHLYARTISCPKIFKPIVRREGKWKTSIEEYSGEKYPLSCVGWCFLMPRDVAADVYLMSLDTPLLHLEDVAMTGIIREKLGDVEVKKLEGGEELCQHKGWPKDRPTNEKITDAWDELKKRYHTR